MTAGKRAAEQFEREHTHEQASLVLPDPIPWAELEKPVDYAGNVLGNRFLERGCGLILFGPAGLGKSTALLQANAEWSAGLPAFHIEPVRALKVILIQTEDSLDDTRETLQGVFDSSIWTPDRLALVRENLVILPPVPGGRPEELGMLLTAAALRYKPDIVAVNPLLAFCPDDPTRELGRLLYQHIDPVLKRHGLAFAGAHHTPKTFNRDTSKFGAYDHQYLAAGDARVANWPRAMLSLEPLPNGIFRFRCVKRWRRIGWRLDGEPVSERFFRYADHGIRWVDASPEEAEQATATESYTRILEVLPEPGEAPVSRDRVRARAKADLNAGRDKADSWLKLGIEDGAVEQVDIPTKTRPTPGFRKTGKGAAP